MKKLFFALTTLAVIGFYACDKIEGPKKEEVVVNDFCKTGIADSIVNKKVLVEDYTGHLCGNCPDAGVYLNDTLKPIYNHCMVVISVHAGFFAGICPNSSVCFSLPANHPANSFTTDFACPVSTAWNTQFGITGNPKGMV